MVLMQIITIWIMTIITRILIVRTLKVRACKLNIALISSIAFVNIVSCKTIKIVDREYLASPIMNIDDTGYDICRLQIKRVELNPGGMGGISYGGCIT